MTTTTILDEPPKAALEGWLKRLGTIEVNADLVRDVAVRTVAHLKGSESQREQTVQAQELELRWYESLAQGKPDWSVYETDYYLGELWACWLVYSRSYLRAIRAPGSLTKERGIVADLEQVTRVVDLGCGFAYTTAGLKSIWPDADVWGTNLDGTRQIELARTVAAEHDCWIVTDVADVEAPVDVVFASEYFEHIPNPIVHLRDVLRALQPRAVLTANAFGTRAIGHFNHYHVDGKWVPAKRLPKLFATEMTRWGFHKVKTRMWNNRPTYWKRDRRGSPRRARGG